MTQCIIMKELDQRLVPSLHLHARPANLVLEVGKASGEERRDNRTDECSSALCDVSNSLWLLYQSFVLHDGGYYVLKSHAWFANKYRVRNTKSVIIN